MHKIKPFLELVDKRIDYYLNNNELNFSKKLEIVLIYLKYFYTLEKVNINSTIKSSVLDWIKDNNDEINSFIKSVFSNETINFEKIPLIDLLDITRIFNIYLMINYINTGKNDYNETFKNNKVAECVNFRYKLLLKYFLDKETESLELTDKNNINQLLERNSALFGFLLKKNEFDIKEFSQNAHENFDLQYLII